MDLTLIQEILVRDGWILCDNEARRGPHRISFFFGSRVTDALTKSFRAIAREDKNRFRHVGVLVAPTTAQMNRLRDSHHADKFSRALFTSFEELQTPGTAMSASRAASFDADIIANTPVGGAPHLHYRLVFDAPKLGNILPPQFFMMDVLPKRTPLGARAVRRAGWRDAVDWTPQPLLKRPFGLCRAYLPHFPADYLKRLVLPPSLALSLHTPQANRFDMLYKVLPDGVGTPLMTKLRRGDKVHMVGPLGRAFDVRTLRAAGIEEVHVVGGGVGIAPLILLVEALRFNSFRVKVFLGMATLESLRYWDELAATFGEKPRDAYVYIDDLLAAGVVPSDIFVSCDREPPRNVRRIPRENLFHGLVPEQYRSFLRRGALRAPSSEIGNDDGRRTQCVPTGSVVAFTCGPNRMMEVMSDICRQAGVPLKVLLEKRMGCGFGVCFSCVQKVRRADGSDDYARVCKEGPIFDAKDILWNNDSKPNLEACGCAARC